MMLPRSAADRGTPTDLGEGEEERYKLQYQLGTRPVTEHRGPLALFTSPTLKWPGVLLGGTSLSLMATGAAPLLTGSAPAMAIAGGSASVLTGTAVAISVRNERRKMIAAEVHLAFTRIAGQVTRFRCSSWKGWFVGLPGRIRLDYHPAGILSGEPWPGAAIKLLKDVLDVQYRVHRIDERLGRVEFRLVGPIPTEPPAEPEARAVMIMRELFGKDARVEIDDVDDAGEPTAVSVRHTVGVRVSSEVLRARVERVVTTMLPGRWRARWDLENDQVRFEVRPTMPTLVTRPTTPVTDPYLIPIGVDEDRQIVGWDLTSDMPHLLVVGKTGKGKTNVIRGVAIECARRGIRVRACDPKRIELIGLRDWPGVEIVATRIEDQIATVIDTYRLMEERYAGLENGSADEDHWDWLVLIVDEFAEFSRRVTEWWASVRLTSDKKICPVLDMYQALVRLARSARIRVVVGLQRPDVRFLGESGEARDNFDSRVSLGRLSADGSRMTWNSPIATSLPGVTGRSIACTSEDDPRETQTFWTPDPRRVKPGHPDTELLQALRPGDDVSIAPRLEVHIPDPGYPPGKNTGPLWVWGAMVESELRQLDDESASATEIGGTAAAALSETDEDAAAEPGQPAHQKDDDEVVQLRPRAKNGRRGGRTSGRKGSVSLAPGGRRRGEEKPVSHVQAREDDQLADYGPPEIVGVTDLAAGDAINLDDADGWVAIETAEPDILDQNSIVISWRSIQNGTDVSDVIIMPSDAAVARRRAEDGQE